MIKTVMFNKVICFTYDEYISLHVTCMQQCKEVYDLLNTLDHKYGKHFFQDSQSRIMTLFAQKQPFAAKMYTNKFV